MADSGRTFYSGANTNSFIAKGDDGQVSPSVLARKGAQPSIISLVTGTEDESFAVVNCTYAADTTNFKLGARGWKMSVTGAVTNAKLLMQPVPPAPSGNLAIRPAQSVCLWVYVPTPSAVTNIQVALYHDASILWLRANTSTPVQPITTGWNLLRWKMCEGLPTGFTGTQLLKAEIYLTSSAATDITIGHLYLETPPKARMIYVADRGYRSFVVNGLPDLRRLKVPVTWAIDILKLGDHAGEYPNGALPYADAITEAELIAFAAAGDSISFHGYDASATAAMTVAQVRTDTLKCLKWLQARGYRGRVWRAAWVQNQATNHAAADPYVLGQSTWDVTTHSVALDSWPPRDMQNIARWEFYNKTDAQIDAQFDILKRTCGLMNVYNHGIGTGYVNDATQASWNRFAYNVAKGISEGWLEATTFEALFAESGGTFQTLNGATVATYTDRDGNRVTKNVL